MKSAKTTKNNQDYKNHRPLVDTIIQCYILCTQSAGTIKTQRYGESEFAEPEKATQTVEKSLPSLNPFSAAEFKVDTEHLFEKVIERHPSLKPTLDAVLYEEAGLPHENIDAKKEAHLINQIGILAEARKINPRTYFIRRRVRLPR